MVLALLNIVFDVFVLSQEILYPGGRFLFRLGVPELVVQLTAHVVQALAAHQMLVRGSYKLSCFGGCAVLPAILVAVLDTWHTVRRPGG